MKPRFILAGFLLLSLIILSFGSLLPIINRDINKNYDNNEALNNNSFLLPQTNTSTSTNNNLINTNTSSQNKPVLFYGDGCPHCAIVENYLKENPPKFDLEKKEVYYNKTNQQELVLRAKSCGLPENEIGVPFLWTGKNCIVGDQPIIDYFKQFK